MSDHNDVNRRRLLQALGGLAALPMSPGPLQQAFAVFVRTPDEIIGDADVECPTRLVGQHIDPVIGHDRRHHGPSGTAIARSEDVSPSQPSSPY